MTLEGKTMKMESAVNEGSTIFEMKLDNATQCVVSQMANNADLEVRDDWVMFRGVYLYTVVIIPYLVVL